MNLIWRDLRIFIFFRSSLAGTALEMQLTNILKNYHMDAQIIPENISQRIMKLGGQGHHIPNMHIYWLCRLQFVGLQTKWIGYSEGHWKLKGVNRYRVLALCSQPLGQIPRPLFFSYIHPSIHVHVHVCIFREDILLKSYFTISILLYLTSVKASTGSIKCCTCRQQTDDLLLWVLFKGQRLWHDIPFVLVEEEFKDSICCPSVNHLLRARRV